MSGSNKWKPGDFITVPNKNILLMNLTLGQLKTYLVLCDMAGAKRTCWPSFETIGKRINQTPRAVKKHIPILEDAGLIAVTRQGTSVNRYKILELEVPATSERQETSEEPEVVNSETLASEPRDTSGVNYSSPVLVNAGSPKQTHTTNKPIEEISTNVEKEQQVLLPVSNAILSDKAAGGIDANEASYGNPAINRVIAVFESAIGPLARPQKQRWAAKTLLSKKYANGSVDALVTVINLVAEHRGEKFFPAINSLEDLRDKWLNVKGYFERLQKANEHAQSFRINDDIEVERIRESSMRADGTTSAPGPSTIIVKQGAPHEAGPRRDEATDEQIAEVTRRNEERRSRLRQKIAEARRSKEVLV